MPERQQPEATHIVRGRVIQVYTAEERTVAGKADTPCLVEVAVDKVDKGNGPSTDRPLYVRGWKSKILMDLFDRTVPVPTPPPPAVPPPPLSDRTVITSVPAPTGETRRAFKLDAFRGRIWVYFRANRDGGYDLLEPKGIERFRAALK
jgi:hypothetical protein